MPTNFVTFCDCFRIGLSLETPRFYASQVPSFQNIFFNICLCIMYYVVHNTHMLNDMNKLGKDRPNYDVIHRYKYKTSFIWFPLFLLLSQCNIYYFISHYSLLLSKTDNKNWCDHFREFLVSVEICRLFFFHFISILEIFSFTFSFSFTSFIQYFTFNVWILRFLH